MYFRPLPHGQGSFLPTLDIGRPAVWKYLMLTPTRHGVHRFLMRQRLYRPFGALPQWVFRNSVMPSTGLLFLPAAKSSGSFVLPLGIFLEMTKCFLIVLDNLERFGESERCLATRVSYRAVSGNSLLKHPQ